MTSRRPGRARPPPRISVVIPARNEAGAIAAVVTAACAHADEVIVVDDGSRDDTAAAATRAGAEVVSLRPGRGKGAALRAGVAMAGGEVVVMLDGDGQDDPHDIPRLVAGIERGADLVVGSRFVHAVERGAIKPLDRLGNRLLTEMLNALFGTRLTDTQAGFKAVRRTHWDALPLRARGFDVETEVLVRTLQRGATVREVPVGRRPRRHGTRALHRVRDGLRIAGCMLRLRVAGPPGA